MTVTLGDHREPVPLNSEDGSKRVWSCADCGGVYGNKTGEETARRCCAEMLCDCGLRVQKNYTKCDRCIAEARAAKDQVVFDKAEKIPWREYDGEHVYSDRQEFYPDVDTMVDAEDDPPEEPPRWAWACTPLKLTFDAKDLIYAKLDADDHYDDAMGSISDKDVEELQKSLDTWCDNQNLVSYFPDYSRVVTCDDIVDERMADLCDEDEVSEGK